MDVERHQNRLASINAELTRMQFITTEEETGTITTNFAMMLYRMPEGTMDSKMYKAKVDERNEKIHSIHMALKEYTPSSLEHNTHQKEEKLRVRLQEERMALYSILVNITPVNGEEFRVKLASLIDEKISIVMCLRMLQIEGTDIGEIY